MKQTIIIAAISSRAYVQAAVNAGFEAIAIDAFADVDTQKIAKKVYQCKTQNGQFEAEDCFKILQKINLSDCLGLCFGAGFEARPELLASIAQRLLLIGNTAKSVDDTKMPHTFFSLCDTLKIAYPPTQFERPVNSLGWLKKQIGGSGGAHIQQALPLDFTMGRLHYYQKIQAGTPYSCLFLADRKNAQVIGFNEQWCEPSTLLPYRYGGAVSHADLTQQVKSTIIEFITKATSFFSLIGLNSCDFLVHENTVYMLEINPRLSASLQLYSAKTGDLFAAHVAACMGNLVGWPSVEQQSRAHHIVYTNKVVRVSVDMDWPEWVCDIPQPNSQILAGAPLCTVVADAHTAKLAKQKVLSRVADLGY